LVKPNLRTFKVAQNKAGMKWALQVKDKVKAAAVLAVIMCVILLTSFSGRQGFDNLGKSMSSIYEDRLLPSAYIFGITDHLYQKRLLHSQYLHGENPQAAAHIQKHNAAIATLIASYETTYLTPEEKAQWGNFKKHFALYSRYEAQQLAGTTTARVPPMLPGEFDSAIQSLNELSRIQVGEGSQLRKSSASIIGNNTILTDLQITLLIVLGIFALVLLSVRDKVLFNSRPHAGLN
jgi:hypothetical protein